MSGAATEQAIASTIRCDRCGRVAGPDMVACPHRPAGGCPFTLRQGKLSGTSHHAAAIAGSLLLAFGAVFLIFPGLLIRGGVGVMISWFGLFMTPFLAAGLGLTSLGLFLVLGRETVLYHPESRALWQRDTLFGVEIYRRVVRGVGALRIDRAPEAPPACPPSLGALAEPAAVADWGGPLAERAAGILEAALLGLLARGRVEVRRARSYRGWFGRPLKPIEGGAYLLVPGEGGGGAPAEGAIEGRLLRAIADWPTQLQSEPWPQGIPIYDAVRAVYEQDRHLAGMWLVELAEDHAVAQGLATKEGGRRKPFVLNPACAAKLEEAARWTRAQRERLAGAHPDLLRSIAAEVQRGGKSRESSS